MKKLMSLFLVTFTMIGVSACTSQQATQSPKPTQTTQPAAIEVDKPTLESADSEPIPPPSTQPNIVFILTDDQDLGTLPYMPKLQTLVTEQGTTFSNFMISMPLCCPSRSTILRGQYGHNTKIMGNDLPFGGFFKFHEMGSEDSTIATWLQEAGYSTMLAGKYLNAFPDQTDLMYIPPGWTEWYSPMAGEPYVEYDYTLNENGKQVEYGDRPEDYGTDVYSRKTIEFIQRAAAEGKPFFAHVSVYAPHWPTTPAPRHAHLFPDAKAPRTPNFNEADVSDKPSYIRDLPLLTEQDEKGIDEEWRRRLQAMQAVDEMVEAIFNTLEATGQLENTFIFYTSDNGYHFGNHRQVLGKTAPYDEEIRVSMIVRGPGVPAGITLEHLTGNIDLAPTWTELAGGSFPDFVDGRSLVPLLGSDPPPISQWRQCFLLEHAPFDAPTSSATVPVSSARTPLGLLEPPDPGEIYSSGTMAAIISGKEALPYRALRTLRYLYVEYPNGELELYNLQEDPYQLENIASSAGPDLLSELSSRLEEMYTCLGESCKAIEDISFSN